MDSNYWTSASRRKVSRRQALRGAALGAGGLAAAALIGCGGDEGDSNAEGTPTSSSGGGATPTTVVSTATSDATAARGGTVTIGHDGDPPNWSVFTASSDTVMFNSFTYDKLLDLKTGPGVDPFETTLVPRIAEAMPEQPDDVTYIFKIRQGVKFQNVDPVNGREMTAEDVVYSVDTLRQQGSFQRDYAPITSVTAVDDTTVEIKTSEPYAPLLNFSAGHYGFRIFPRELVEQDLLANTAVGTGPYIRESWEQGSRTTYKRNPDYWDDQSAWVDEYQILIIPDSEPRLAAYRTGQIDVLAAPATDIACVATQDLQAQSQDSNITKVPGPSGWLALNTTQPPFDDIRVRQALALLYDREAERQALYCGETYNTGLIPLSGALDTNEFEESSSMMRKDVDEAKKLLSAAGFENGFKTSAVWTPQYGEIYAQALERIIGDFAVAGIEVEPISYEYGVWIADIYRGSYAFDGILWGPSRFYADADPYVAYWLHPDGIANQSRVNDPELTALVEKQRGQLNPDERWETLHEIQRMEAAKQYYIWREAGVDTYFSAARVRNLVPHRGYDSSEYFQAFVAEA